MQNDAITSQIGILGAGISGVMMGMLLRRHGIDSFTIYEKQTDVGGTWLRNSYPGLCCDVPSHLYSYTFAPNPDWSKMYATQPEIQRYIRNCADRFDLLNHIRFATDVRTAHFDTHRGVWKLRLADGQTAEHRILISATGGLTSPNLPRIQGLDDFEGTYWHSGNWRHNVDLTGKNVAVVGSAASAVQVVPEVARRAARLTVFQRSPNWIVARDNRPYSENQKLAFRADRQVWRKHWRTLYRRSLFLHRVFRRDEQKVEDLRQICLGAMYAAIKDQEMREMLTPDYEPGCKRVLVSDDYYPALAQDHVTLVPHGASRATLRGLTDSEGTERPFDIIIFCTGYKLGGRADGSAAVEVHGVGGRTLAEALAESPRAFNGIAIPGFPNYFTVCGINGVAAYTSLFLSAEINAESIVNVIKYINHINSKYVDARESETIKMSDDLQDELQKMSWSGDCTNFYKNRDGRILSFHPGTLGQMRRSSKMSPEIAFEYTAWN